MIGAYNIASRFPPFVGNTPTYNDEGTGTTGWTLTGCTLTQPDASTVRVVQSALTTATCARAVTMPVANKDWTLYGKVRARATAGDNQSIGIRGSSGSQNMILLLNYNSVTSTVALGTLSLRWLNSANNTKKSKSWYNYRTAPRL